jgi:two-component system, chemotaxis family, CheB/CheR fusion protein
VRQKEGLDVASVLSALTRDGAFPVRVAADGEPLRPNHVYVAAPDDLITVADGHVRTRPASEPVGRRGTFDTLLVSLAEAAGERAVAVLLSGLGSDGSAGVVATKKFGGLSIAEDDDGPDPAAQGATDPAAVADLVLPADRIAGEIARYVANLSPAAAEEREEEDGALATAMVEVATILRTVTGHDFHGYKRGTFERRIRRRMLVLQLEGGIDSYVDRLRTDREEVQHLFQDLLIGVTQFFRDPAEFDALERELPRLFAGKGPTDQFRVWVLGCATGEEAYSIAILLREHMATLDYPPDVQIFATDLDARALSLARIGRYADTIANHVRPDRLERWFVREGDTWCVVKELREMCIFSPHNIVKDAPFSRIDILSCRNLLIYLNQELQDRVLPIFHFSLVPAGVLFLGSSENATRHGKLFAPVDRRNRLFRRLETATRVIPDFPLATRASGGGSGPAVPPPPFGGRLTPALGRQADALAERFAPAYVVVDAHGDVLHFSGRTGRYLEPVAGAATLSLVALVHRDLRLDVRAALHRALAEGRRVDMPRLTFNRDDRAWGVNVIVEPLASGDVTALAVVFQDTGPLPDGSGAGDDRLSGDEQFQRLEAELRVTKDRLQATIEELESTNEELKSSNEEYQSINEELQSANEEMETSKEELQSVNEELQTVNGELAHRVGELGRTNSDLKNLLESTQIATIFLDPDLRVRNFTPAATDIFHLLDTDVGRPLGHVVSRVAYPELHDDVRRVLKTLVPVDRQVVDGAAGRHFAARVLPYRSVDNHISGAVVTFTDLTAVQAAEAALRRSEEDYRALFASIDEAFCVVEMIFDAAGEPVDYRFLSVNPAFQRQTGLGNPVGKTALELVPGLDQRWFRAYGRIAVTGRPARFEDEAAAMGRWYDVYAFRTGAPEERKVAILFRDIGERKQMELDRRRSEERLQAFVTASSDSVYRMSPDWSEMLFMEGRTFLTGKDAPSATWLDEYILPEDQPQVSAAIARAIADGSMFALEHRVRTVDGGIGWTSSRAVPIFDEAGTITEWFGTATDVTELHETARALQEAERRQQLLIEGVPQLVWRAAADGAWTWASPQWTAYTGQAEADSHGAGWLACVHPDDRAAAVAAQAAAVAHGGLDVEYRIRRAADGASRWFRARAAPVRDEAGAILEWLGTSTDIDDLRALQTRQELLVAELQHRVRNMLTVVRSVFAQTAESGEDLEEVARHFTGRLDALARTQVIVTRSAEGRVDLENLIRDELLSVGAQEGAKLHVSGPDVTLGGKTAESIGLAIHELTTNALKYGALRHDAASLEIVWHVTLDGGGARRLVLTWTEKGVPAVPTRPTREGFGRELIEEALPYQLGAETRLSFEGGGVRCTITVPLPVEQP